ncbi:hypothetical protein EB001_23370 [bacterium]|jgi:hypothetical protein|nr:hypothetical protein [bacterium]
MKYIAYPNNSKISIIIPSLDCGLSLDQIAKKDVPTGIPYKYIESEFLPQDRVFRDAWELDFSNPDGYGA